MALSDLFHRRRREEPEAAVAASAASSSSHTKALSRFLATLSSRQQPLLLDLGPVVGSNITFFGEELGCKIVVEDLGKDIDRFVTDGRIEELPAFLNRRLAHSDESVDGILCWDILDYLDRAAAQSLAQALTRVLKPDGALLAFFATSEPPPGLTPSYQRHVVVDAGNLELRPYPAARGRLKSHLNRDIQRMFEPLRITDQFLLKNNVREVLFRKPAAAVQAPAPAAG